MIDSIGHFIRLQYETPQCFFPILVMMAKIQTMAIKKIGASLNTIIKHNSPHSIYIKSIK